MVKKVLLVVAVAAVVLVVAVLFFGVGSTTNGVLSFAGGQVKVSKDGAAAKSVTAGTQIFAGDSVETGPGGHCTVEFEDRSSFTLAPGTKLTVQVLDKKGTARIFHSEVKLVSGSVRVSVPTGAGQKSTTKILTANGDLLVKGTEFRAAFAGGKTLLSVFEGSVTASAQGKEIAVNAGQGVSINAGQPPSEPTSLPAPPKLNSPTRSQEIVVEDIQCNWDAADGAAGYHLELAKNPKFKDIVADVTSDQLSAVASGPAMDGPYYVRVSGFDSTGLEGLPSDTVTVMYLFHEKGQ